MDKKVIELNRHDPTVDSVIERLDRYRKKIKHITVVLQWDEGSSDIFHDTVTIPDLSFDSLLLTKYVQGLMDGDESD